MVEGGWAFTKHLSSSSIDHQPSTANHPPSPLIFRIRQAQSIRRARLHAGNLQAAFRMLDLVRCLTPLPLEVLDDPDTYPLPGIAHIEDRDVQAVPRLAVHQRQLRLPLADLDQAGIAA